MVWFSVSQSLSILCASNYVFQFQIYISTFFVRIFMLTPRPPPPVRNVSTMYTIYLYKYNPHLTNPQNICHRTRPDNSPPISNVHPSLSLSLSLVSSIAPKKTAPPHRTPTVSCRCRSRSDAKASVAEAAGASASVCPWDDPPDPVETAATIVGNKLSVMNVPQQVMTSLSSSSSLLVSPATPSK